MKKTKTRQEVADEYGLSRSSFWRKLKGIDLLEDRKILMPCHLARIYRHLGFPGGMPDKEKTEWRREMLLLDQPLKHDDT
ncbi:MAG: hypothetical protein IAE84_17705 [Saprospiraceae bacterium]|nr:hypothetical protein [Saprospiraceae bacterium]HRK80608.1 hypothetical protein [Saprospiraceae bacterium]